MNIIVLEDESIIALHISNTLFDLGHNVVKRADNGEEVLEFIKSNKNIDLILIDIKLNGEKSGIDIANTIFKKYPTISIVFVTSYKDSETIQLSKECKPLGFLIKPIIDAEIEAISMVVEKQREKLYQNKHKFIQISSYYYDEYNKFLYDSKKNIVKLTANEKKCFDLLYENKDYYLSPTKIIEEIWGKEDNRISSLRELVSRLRKKVKYINISAIPNLGYKLDFK